MNDKLSQSQLRLGEGLYDLYEIGGLDLVKAGTRGLQRELIIDLETSALTPDRGVIIHFYAVNRWAEEVVGAFRFETQRLGDHAGVNASSMPFPIIGKS